MERNPANNPESLPVTTLDRIHVGLERLPGVVGVALGGSRARGTATANSDIDIGLYYNPAAPPPFGEVLDVARELDDSGETIGHGEYGEWGPWINGGVWLTVDGYKTDILFRDANRVAKVVRAAVDGRVEFAYQPGHPHGFSSAIYAGEVFHTVPLYDPLGTLGDLRQLVDPYPSALAATLCERFGWEAGFSLDGAKSAAERGDLVHITGCAYRTVACMLQVAFAHNRRYLLNEKGALAATDTMAVPGDFRVRIDNALAQLSPVPAALRSVLDELSQVHDELTALVSA